MNRKFLAIQSLSGSRGASAVGWVQIDFRGWVDGETPVEDYGMFLLLDEEISGESAGRLFAALMGHDEGEAPEVKEEITRDDKLFRSVHAPQLLTPEEFRIFSYLVNLQPVTPPAP